jgi:hypothetical protein
VSWGFAGRSAGSAVLIDEACNGLAAIDPGRWQRDNVGVIEGRELISALVGPVAVEVSRIVVEDLLGVAAVEDQQSVGALLADGAHELLGVRVAIGGAVTLLGV